MKRLLSIFVLVGVMAGQQSSRPHECITDGIMWFCPDGRHPSNWFDRSLPDLLPVHLSLGAVDRADWRALPSYDKTHHFAFINQHPTRTKLGILGAGLFTGWAIWYWNHPHCNHYEYGQSGVNVWCPKDRR